MGWQFAAFWVDDPDRAWKWVWRRVTDDSRQVIAESMQFSAIDDCIEDARCNGFDESACGID